MQNKNVTEASLILGVFVATIGVLFVSLASLIVGILTLLRTRKLLGLAENRMEYLRQEQERLAVLREERQTLVEVLNHERQKRLEGQQKVDYLEREHKASPEVQQENPQLGQERAMKPSQEVWDASFTTGSADDERPGGISNTGTEGRSSEAYNGPDDKVTVDGEPIISPKEGVRDTKSNPTSGSTGGGATQDEHESYQELVRGPQADATNRKESVLVRAMRIIRQR